MTFTEYLKKQTHKKTAVGDFASDWIADRDENKPRSYKHFKAIENFVNSQGASNECIEAARSAWDEWKGMEAIEAI